MADDSKRHPVTGTRRAALRARGASIPLFDPETRTMAPGHGTRIPAVPASLH
jgi:hypothetical protein